MTELFLPLPGTRRLMVCPLEVALHRDSGDCRLVEPDAPELEVIGDARDVITMQRIYSWAKCSGAGRECIGERWPWRHGLTLP